MSEAEAKRAAATFAFPEYRAIAVPLRRDPDGRWCLRVYHLPSWDWRNFLSVQEWRRYYGGRYA